MKEEISIGLDVGKRHINMIELANGPNGLTLLDFASVSLSPDRGEEERLSQLKNIAQEKGIAGEPVNIGICGGSVIVRYIDLPRMNEDEVAQALKYEAQQYIPFKMEEVVFDYHILNPSAADSNARIKVLLVAAKKEAITELVELIRQAHLEPNLIDVNSFCLINCFQLNGPQRKEDDVSALLNLEFDLANINILQGQMPFFSRDIPLPEDILSLHQGAGQEGDFFATIRPLLGSLIREIRLSFDYFESEFAKQVSVVYFSGEGARGAELLAFFNSQLDKQVVRWNPLQGLIVDPARIDTKALLEVSSMLAPACGLAFRRQAKWSR